MAAEVASGKIRRRYRRRQLDSDVVLCTIISTKQSTTQHDICECEECLMRVEICFCCRVVYFDTGNAPLTKVQHYVALWIYLCRNIVRLRIGQLFVFHIICKMIHKIYMWQLLNFWQMGKMYYIS